MAELIDSPSGIPEDMRGDTHGSTLVSLMDATGAPLGTVGNPLYTNSPSGGSAASIADGADVAEGHVADAAYTSGSGTVVSILKGIFARLRGGQATMANSLPVVVASDQGTVPVSGTVNSAAGAVVAATSPPSATSVALDTPYTFSSAVRHVMMQNKTSANLYYAFDAAASLGSFVLYPQQVAVLDVPCTVLHLYTVAAQNINGAADANLYVQGRA